MIVLSFIPPCQADLTATTFLLFYFSSNQGTLMSFLLPS